MKSENSINIVSKQDKKFKVHTEINQINKKIILFLFNIFIFIQVKILN